MTHVGRAVIYIQEGLDEISHMISDYITESDSDIVEDKIYYDFPTSMISLKDIRILNHDNSEDKYKSIPRLMYNPVEEDADGV